MYDNFQTAERIKQRAKKQRIVLKNMLSDLGLGINLISHLAKGQNISAVNLASIADYLNCSIDYLMGRTDCPDVITMDDDGNLQRLKKD